MVSWRTYSRRSRRNGASSARSPEGRSTGGQHPSRTFGIYAGLPPRAAASFHNGPARSGAGCSPAPCGSGHPGPAGLISGVHMSFRGPLRRKPDAGGLPLLSAPRASAASPFGSGHGGPWGRGSTGRLLPRSGAEEISINLDIGGMVSGRISRRPLSELSRRRSGPSRSRMVTAEGLPARARHSLRSRLSAPSAASVVHVEYVLVRVLVFPAGVVGP